MKRQVFILSDGTGITAETLGNSLLSQFEGIDFERTTIPYVNTLEKAQDVVTAINMSCEDSDELTLVFATLVNPDIRACIEQSQGQLFDLFHTFLAPMEKSLKAKSSYTVGRTHGLIDSKSYKERIAAIDYSLAHDDGIKLKNYDKADIILCGVSRSGKTPTCLYMALQFGLLAANYPFTEEDFYPFKLPEKLRPFKNKLFGLTIDPISLHNIREERRPNSPYASFERCQLEVSDVEKMYKKENIPFLNSTRHSIEEISTRILDIRGIKRKVL